MSEPTSRPVAFNGAVATNAEAIAVLEAALNDARSGRLCSVGVVGVSPTGNVQVGAGGDLIMQVFFGCSLLQDKITGALTDKPSKIVRPYG